MKDRIRQIMEAQHMSQQVFAQLIEVSPATLSSIFNDRTKPTLVIVDNIKRKLPKINTDWLLFGTGGMYGAAASPTPADQTPHGDGVQLTLDFDDTGTTPPPSNQPSGWDGLVVSGEPISGATPPTPVPTVANTRAAMANIRPAAMTTPVQREPTIKYIDRPQRKITEIRIYFDDQTFETFLPEKK